MVLLVEKTEIKQVLHSFNLSYIVYSNS